MFRVAPFIPRVGCFTLPAAGFLIAAGLLGMPASGIASPSAPQAATTTQSHRVHRHTKAHRANAAPAEHVTYTGGQLSVQSSGADLAVVLGAVQQATGVKITGVAAAQKQTLVGEFGPGDPASVLAEVLDGKRLNYIILKSQSDPRVIRSVMLFAQSAAPAQPLSAPAPAPPRPAAAPQPAPENIPRNPQAGEPPAGTEPAPQGEQPEPETAPPSADRQPRASH